jgi:hypothetical protein
MTPNPDALLVLLADGMEVEEVLARLVEPHATSASKIVPVKTSFSFLAHMVISFYSSVRSAMYASGPQLGAEDRGISHGNRIIHPRICRYCASPGNVPQCRLIARVTELERGFYSKR